MGKRVGKKKLPIGIESFDEICSEDFYYVDKTGLIRDFDGCLRVSKESI